MPNLLHFALHTAHFNFPNMSVAIASTSTAEAVTKKKTRRGHGHSKKTQVQPAASKVASMDEQDQEMSDLMDRPKGSALEDDESNTPIDVEIVNIPPENDDDALMIDAEPTDSILEPTTQLNFSPLSAEAQIAALAKKSETRRVTVPPHRMTPLKKEWVNVFGPLTELLGLQVRMNVQRRAVELRVRLKSATLVHVFHTAI